MGLKMLVSCVCVCELDIRRPRGKGTVSCQDGSARKKSQSMLCPSREKSEVVGLPLLRIVFEIVKHHKMLAMMEVYCCVYSTIVWCIINTILM